MKKRYQVALTEDHVARFQALSVKLGMPKSVMSTVLDDALKGVVESMEKFVSIHQSGKSLTIADVFTEMGRQMEKMEEEVADVKQAQETKVMASGPVRTKKQLVQSARPVRKT